MTSDNKGKQLRREGFTLAEERYGASCLANVDLGPLVDGFWIVAYKPTLEEVEKILAEAGLDEEEMRKGATGPSPSGDTAGLSRNRR